MDYTVNSYHVGGFFLAEVGFFKKQLPLICCFGGFLSNLLRFGEQ